MGWQTEKKPACKSEIIGSLTRLWLFLLSLLRAPVSSSVAGLLLPALQPVLSGTAQVLSEREDCPPHDRFCSTSSKCKIAEPRDHPDDFFCPGSLHGTELSGEEPAANPHKPSSHPGADLALLQLLEKGRGAT